MLNIYNLLAQLILYAAAVWCACMLVILTKEIFIPWFKSKLTLWLGVVTIEQFDVTNRDKELKYSQVHRVVMKAVNIIKERTDIHADIHYKAPSTIIMIGKYRNRDYVKVFNMEEREWIPILEQLRGMEKFGHINRIDAPPQMDCVINRELRKEY